MRTAAPGPSAGRSWTPLTVANAGLAFALEMGLLAALCYWGFKTGRSTPARILLGIGAPALAGLTWGLFLAAGGPKFTLPLVAQVVIKIAVFAVAALALRATGHPTLALAFGGLAVLSVAVEYATR
ncbi:DUF2568 domain-containing protein [Kitasatospora acidiphila]|uniref:DUF2568 domain-containing protein n=1 Tax=Kitasatospora acidiphila TaxID=2567942 RepID=A0A540WBE5_9ACTN|nr:YrdB family protein [Kitasatospora acidiphila]TQF06237.1 DUF2568 domain-containing protein [Kitasatospora acidiphila]